MIDLLSRPWPWYVAGPLIGLLVPVLLVLGNRQFGVSSALSGLVPRELVRWSALLTARGALLVVGGGFLVGCGAAYAGGCTRASPGAQRWCRRCAERPRLLAACDVRTYRGAR